MLLFWTSILSLSLAGVIRSAYDHAMPPSILKAECNHHVKLRTYEEARLFIGEYIRSYKNERIQTKTKLTPLEKRSQFAA